MSGCRHLLLAVLLTSALPAYGRALNPCQWLGAGDFEAAGLRQGKPKLGSGAHGPECVWSPVVGSGGFLTARVISAKDFERRKARMKTMTPLEGLADEAILYKAAAGWALMLRKGETFVIIDGNAMLTREKLEPLGRAVAAKLP